MLSSRAQVCDSAGVKGIENWKLKLKIGRTQEFNFQFTFFIFTFLSRAGRAGRGRRRHDQVLQRARGYSPARGSGAAAGRGRVVPAGTQVLVPPVRARIDSGVGGAGTAVER